jgi:hypothetical protein
MNPRGTTWMLVILAAGIGANPAFAEDDARVTALRAAEVARFKANDAADAKKLGELLADDLEYVHSNGEIDTKASFIESLTSGRRDYVASVPDIENTRIFGDFAIIRGKAKVTIADAGNTRDLNLGYTDIWRWNKSKWQMVAWRSARIPEAVPAERSEDGAKAANAARFAAAAKNDSAALEKLLADDLDYCHSSGECDTKRGYIDNLKSGTMKYISIEPTVDRVKHVNDVAVLIGKAKVKSIRAGVERNLHIGYTSTFVWREGRWQLTSWRSLTLPDSPSK